MDSIALIMVDWEAEAKLAQAASKRIEGPEAQGDEEGSGECQALSPSRRIPPKSVKEPVLYAKDAPCRFLKQHYWIFPLKALAEDKAG